MTEGTIAAVLKQPGDAIKEDDVIAQIETDKVTIDVKYTSKEPGVMTSVMVKAGDVVQVGGSPSTYRWVFTDRAICRDGCSPRWMMMHT